MRAGLLLATLLVLGACASPSPTDGSSGACVGQLAALESRARAHGLNPGFPVPVPGFPDLATGRNLGVPELMPAQAAERDAFLDRLQALGAQRRALLFSILDRYGGAPGGGGVPGDAVPSADALEACAADLRESRMWDEGDWADLAAAARVPDAYSSGARTLGLYPVTSRFAALGVRRLQEDLGETFALPLAALPRRGDLLRFEPAPVSLQGSELSLPLPGDALGPRIDGMPAAVLEALFQRHAPVLDIDVAGAFDRPGEPYFPAPGSPGVRGDKPAAYRYASLMPFAGRLRLQLVYVFWFSARPKAGFFDSLGGPMDGLVWRVTLDDEGRALLYDSIHPCGCYHHFFPGPRLRLRPEAREFPEPPLVLQDAPRLRGRERPVLRVASGTHYLQRIYAAEGGAPGSGESPARVEYVQHPYASLYAVDGPKGPMSLFDAQGFVPGSARGERFYLWPMGVPSPGAMRDRGRQATAFLGRRHFDDAALLDRLFEFTGPENTQPRPGT